MNYSSTQILKQNFCRALIYARPFGTKLPRKKQVSACVENTINEVLSLKNRSLKGATHKHIAVALRIHHLRAEVDVTEEGGDGPAHFQLTFCLLRVGRGQDQNHEPNLYKTNSIEL